MGGGEAGESKRSYDSHEAADRASWSERMGGYGRGDIIVQYLSVLGNFLSHRGAAGELVYMRWKHRCRS